MENALLWYVLLGKMEPLLISYKAVEVHVPLIFSLLFSTYSFPPFLFFFPSNSSLFYCLSFPCSFLLSLMNSVFLLIGKVISQHKDDLLSMLDHFNIQVCMSGKVIVLLMLVNIL